MGLAAALIPLAVHLLHRGRPRVIEFSNLAFLRELHLSRMRGVRLRQWLVLLLRTLALASLVLAFARPSLQTGAAGLGDARPTRAVLLLDDSFSTRYAAPGGRIFDQLRQRTGEALALFDDERDEVYLVPFADRADSADRARPAPDWLAGLDERAPGEGGTDLAGALQTAADLLAEADGRHREIYLFTDLARPGWSAVSPPAPDDPLARVPIFVIGPPGQVPRPNLYIAGHRVTGWLAAPGHPLDVSVTVGLFGEESRRVDVDLFVDGERVQRRQVTVPPGETVGAQFALAPRRSGRLTGFVEVEADALPLDNRRYFTLDVPDRVAIVLAGPRLADTYYARRALTAAATGDAALRVDAVAQAELDASRLEGADVLVLCNLEAPTAPLVRAVRDFAAAGGGVLLLPGPAADLAALNRQLLADLVPASLAGVVGRPGEPAFVGLDTTHLDWPLFSGLLRDAGDRPRFHAAFDLAPQRQLAVVAQFDDGRPALVEGRSAAGRALLWAAPLDLAWTDLPLRGLFVPLLHRMCRYLAQPAGHEASYTVGDRAFRRLPGLGVGDRVQVETPSGRRRYVEPETALGELLWKMPELTESGIWRVLAPAGGAIDEFAVNVDPAEADLRDVPPAEVESRLGPGRARLLAAAGDVRGQIRSARYGRELWREFLGLAGLLLLLELWLARAPEAQAAPGVGGVD